MIDYLKVRGPTLSKEGREAVERIMKWEDDSYRSVMGLEPGCCSACTPCSHQKASPYTLCEVCRPAPVSRPDRGEVG